MYVQGEVIRCLGSRWEQLGNYCLLPGTFINRKQIIIILGVNVSQEVDSLETWSTLTSTRCLAVLEHLKDSLWGAQQTVLRRRTTAVFGSAADVSELDCTRFQQELNDWRLWALRCHRGTPPWPCQMGAFCTWTRHHCTLLFTTEHPPGHQSLEFRFCRSHMLIKN